MQKPYFGYALSSCMHVAQTLLEFYARDNLQYALYVPPHLRQGKKMQKRKGLTDAVFVRRIEMTA